MIVDLGQYSYLKSLFRKEKEVDFFWIKSIVTKHWRSNETKIDFLLGPKETKEYFEIIHNKIVKIIGNQYKKIKSTATLKEYLFKDKHHFYKIGIILTGSEISLLVNYYESGGVAFSEYKLSYPRDFYKLMKEIGNIINKFTKYLKKKKIDFSIKENCLAADKFKYNTDEVIKIY